MVTAMPVKAGWSHHWEKSVIHWHKHKENQQNVLNAQCALKHMWITILQKLLTSVWSWRATGCCILSLCLLQIKFGLNLLSIHTVYLWKWLMDINHYFKRCLMSCCMLMLPGLFLLTWKECAGTKLEGGLYHYLSHPFHFLRDSAFTSSHSISDASLLLQLY